MKQVEIEKLLHWTYRDELAKRHTSSAEGLWASVADYGQRGGVDVGHDAAQRYPHFGLPHPDAERIEVAVSALPKMAIDWKANLPTMAPDLALLLEQRDVISVGSLNTAALVTMHARMGTRPDWYDEKPRPVMVMALKGPHAMIVGECKGRNLYTAGSYCPLRYEPSPLSILAARAEYIAWHAGLVKLAETLRLSDHTPTPPKASPLPWLTPESSLGQVIQIERERASTLPLTPDRGRAGPRKKYSQASAVRYPLAS